MKYEKLEISLRYWLNGRKYFNAMKALEFARSFHTGMRKDGVTREFEHQITITHYLRTLESSLMFPEETLATSLLHDVVEDYDSVTIETIDNLFGSTVAKSVNAISKVKKGIKRSDEDYFFHLALDPIASVCKGGDRAHNFQTMHGVFSDNKQVEYISECRKHIVPMLKKARRNFPQQESVYENIKLVLNSQMQLIELALAKT